MASSRDEARRADKHSKARAAMLSDFEKQMADMQREAERSGRPAAERFVGKTESMEETLKKQTVGLVSAEDFKKRREELEEYKRKEALRGEASNQERKQKKSKKAAKATLSFAMDDEEEGDDAPVAKRAKKSTAAAGGDAASGSVPRTNLKNPNVDTSFLPDRAREEREAAEREALRREWLEKQDALKKEEVEITYSYWDGTGHRRTVQCLKGDSIAAFLEKCRQQFPELRNVAADNLMYIKEDLIIPHHFTFYDFIVNKARGKSGPLFHFDVHDDVRMLADATVEKDESHAGKVVERSWYNRNKHIFPASRWEVWDPKKEYGSYTIGDATN